MENGELVEPSLTNGDKAKSVDVDLDDSSFSSSTSISTPTPTKVALSSSIFNTTSEASGRRLGHYSEEEEEKVVVVDNLIDFDDDDADDNATPSYLSPTTSVKMFNKSTGSSTLGDESGQEDYFEGVANGNGNGAANGNHRLHHQHSLLDTPITPVRGSPFNSSLLSTGSGKRVTTSALASHLYYGRAGGSSTRSGSRRSSFNSDVESMSASDPGLGGGGHGQVGNGSVVSHSDLSELTSQMAKIQQQLEHQMNNEDKHIRLKQENAVLQERVNTLEEQMLLNEERWRQKLTDEDRKYRDLLTRSEREKVLELDANGLRHQLLEREHSQCTLEKQKLLSDLDHLKKKCDRLEETVSDLQEELDSAKDTHKLGEQRLWKQKEDTEKRLRLALETCDELRREADRLRKERGYVDGTASELEEELSRLKEEQKRLRETNDDLHAELLQASVEHGRKLLSDGPSLAEEMDRMSKDQVMEALRDQEIVNQKLRAYVDGILLRIIEMHPAILEIKPGEKGLDPF